VIDTLTKAEQVMRTPRNFMWSEQIDAFVLLAAEYDRLQARVAELQAENLRLRRTSIVDNAYGPGLKVEFDDEDEEVRPVAGQRGGDKVVTEHIDSAELGEAINRIDIYLDYRNGVAGESEFVIHGYWDGVDTLEAGLTESDVELLLNAVRLYRPGRAVLATAPTEDSP
jgi:hypothetical protein